MIKKILFPFISAFLVYQTVSIYSVILKTEADDFSIFSSFLLAFIIALCATGVFAFVGFAYPTSRILPGSYYRLQNPEKLKSVYRILGVHYFRMALMVFFWGNKKNRKKYFDGTKTGLRNFIYQTHQSEFGHLMPFICITALCLPLLFLGHIKIVLFMTSINVIGNLYPIILQRHHRIRIEKIVSDTVI